MLRPLDSSEASLCCDRYLRTLRGVGAVYAAAGLTGGAFYRVETDGALLGCVHIDGDTLSAVLPECPESAESLFVAAIESGVKNAVVYPNDWLLLRLSAAYRPRIEPLAHIFEFRHSPTELGANPHPPLSPAYMCWEEAHSQGQQLPFRRHELRCVSDGDARRVFRLGDKVEGILSDVPFAEGQWDVSVSVAAPYRRQGLGATVLRILAETAVDYHKLPSACIGDDPAAFAVLKKAGFTVAADVLKLTFDR